MKKNLLIFALGVFYCALSFGASREWLDATRPTKTYQDLGGEWDYRDMDKAPYFQSPLPKDGWKKWAVPNRKDTPTKCVYRWWKTNFKLSDNVREALEKGERALLYFGGRSFRWQARLNGKVLIDSLDPFNQFNLDVTKDLNLNGNNELVIGTTDVLGIAKDRDPNKFIAVKANGLCSANLIWGDVELRVRPQSRIEDIFVKTFWRRKELELDAEVLKAGDGWELGGEVLDQKGERVLKIPFEKASKKEKDISFYKFSHKWADPIAWNVDNPYLYTLKMELKDPAGKVRDHRRVEFGFREIWVDGENLVMNGRRLFLARQSIWPPMPSPERIKKLANDYAKTRGINTLRVMREIFYSIDELAWYADRLGIMLQPQHFCNPNRHDAFKPEFWNNYFKFIKRWIKAERNHPSIIMWLLSNEALWCLYYRDDERFITKKLYEAAEIAKELDPTRLSQFDGDWDLPPKATHPVANLHYPFTPGAHCYPTECWRFLNPTEPITINGLTRKFTWFGDRKKPIIVGEFIWMWSGGNRPWADSRYGGDEVFDWNYWRKRGVFNRNLRWFTDVWRVARFAGVNPWSHARSHFRFLIPLENVVIRDQFRTFFSNEKIDLKAWALNDTPNDHDYEIKWSLMEGKKELFSKSKDFKILGGGIEPFKLGLQFPEVSKATDLELRIQIFRKSKMEKRFDEKYPVRVHPKTPLVWPANTVLYDPVGETKNLFESLGLKPKIIDSLDQLDTAKSLIIGKNSLKDIPSKVLTGKLADFVNKGANVLCLSQAKYPFDFAYPGIYCPPKSEANFSWIRSKGHPVLEGLKDIDLGLWRPGDWVCEKAFEKPRLFTGCPWRPLIDIGNVSGLSSSPLLEVSVGEGRYLLCTMNLEKAKSDPGARLLLANLLKDIPNSSQKRSPLRFISKTTPALKKLLLNSGIWAKSDKENSEKTFLVNANTEEITAEKLSEKVKNGATGFIFNLTPENVSKWAKVIPGGFELKPVEIVDGCLIDYKKFNPLLKGVSNQEFFWACGTWTEGFRRIRESPSDIHGVESIAKVANNQIVGAKGEALLKPEILFEIKDGKGRWFLSTIDFEAGAQYMPTTSYWLLQNVFNNLNVAFDSSKIRKISALHTIDLRKFVNRGFQDDVEGDGKGGWSDQGSKYDLRFFPVNLSGINSIGEPDPPPETFPEIMKFEGVKFQIIDPRTNDGKSMIALEPRTNQRVLPEGLKHDCLREVKIPVNRRFDRFYVLHTSAWTVQNKKLWTYILNYDDGSKTEFPIFANREVADWSSPKSTSLAHVAWRGEAMGFPNIGIYICPFENPFPEKKVKSIEIISNLQSYGGIIAITLADLESLKKK